MTPIWSLLVRHPSDLSCTAMLVATLHIIMSLTHLTLEPRLDQRSCDCQTVLFRNEQRASSSVPEFFEG